MKKIILLLAMVFVFTSTINAQKGLSGYNTGEKYSGEFTNGSATVPNQTFAGLDCTIILDCLEDRTITAIYAVLKENVTSEELLTVVVELENTCNIRTRYEDQSESEYTFIYSNYRHIIGVLATIYPQEYPTTSVTVFVADNSLVTAHNLETKQRNQQNLN